MNNENAAKYQQETVLSAPIQNHWWRTCKEEEKPTTQGSIVRDHKANCPKTAANANQPMDPINAVHLARYAQHDRTNMGRY